jgi:hypothetical protein
MENDSIRSSGGITLVELWIGELREVRVTREAIESFLQLPPDKAAVMSDQDRREFVRTSLPLLMAAANRLLALRGDTGAIMIEAGQLSGHASGRSADRRQGDRRKGDRRKLDLGPPPSGERRK